MGTNGDPHKLKEWNSFWLTFRYAALTEPLYLDYIVAPPPDQ